MHATKQCHLTTPFSIPPYSIFPNTLSKSSCAKTSVPGLFVHQATLFPLLLSPRIPHHLLIQRAAPLRNRPTPAIHNAAPPCPLPRRLDADILGLELPASTRRVDGVPYAQRIVQLEAELGDVLVGVQGEEFLEGGEEEECGPVCEGGVD